MMKTMKKRRTLARRLLPVLVALTMLIPAALLVAPVPLAEAASWPGPDGFGYEGSIIAYNWVEISGTGTAVYLGEADWDGPFITGFTFPFYGSNWDEFYISSEGYISFGSGSADWTNDELPNSNAPNNIIALTWDDMDPANPADPDPVYYQSFASCPIGSGTCLVVQYQNYHLYPYRSAIVVGTFEAILYESGNIIIQFQDAGDREGSGSTTGIEGNNFPADHGLTYAYNTAGSLYDGLAILIGYAEPDLEASYKTVSPGGTAVPGQTLDYEIHLVNAGALVAHTRITDTLSSDLDPVSVDVTSPPEAIYDSNLHAVLWAGDIAPGPEVVIQFSADVRSPMDAPQTIISNTARMDDGVHDPFDIHPPVQTIVNASPNLQTSTKAVITDTADPGDVLTYTITLSNTGDMNTWVSVQDIMPNNTTYVPNSLTFDTGNGYYDSLNTWIWWEGLVTPGQLEVITYAVQIDTVMDQPETTIYNDAHIEADAHDPFNTPGVTTLVHAEPDMSASTKTVNPAEARPGDELEYTITLVNSGDMTAHDAVVLDEIPAHTAYVNLSASATSGSVEYQSSYNRIRWTGDVEPGNDVIITYHVQVNFPLNDGTEIANFGTVDDGVHTPFDTNTVVTTIHSEPNLSTSSKTVDLADAVPGQVLQYTITLVNTGDTTAVAAVTDELPPEVSHAGGPTVHNGPPASWNPTTRRISWNGEVMPGTNVTIEYYATVNSPLDDGTVINNTATVDDGVHPAFDTAPAARTTVHSAPHLVTSTKEVDRAVAPPGELIEYTITLENSGNMNASTAMMTDTLPGEVAFVSGPIIIGSGTASYDPATNRILWNGPVNTDHPVTIRYTVRLDAGLTGGSPVENIAILDDGRSNVFEIGPATTYVGHELGLSLTDNQDVVRPGDQITYTVAFSGTEPLSSGFVRVDVPPNTTLVAFSPGGINNGVYVDWNLIDLQPGFHGERFIVVELEPVLDNGMVISTTAYVAGDGQSNRTTESAMIVSTPGWETSIKTADRFIVEPTASLSYTIHLVNTGDMHAHTATLEDTLPPQVTCVDGSVTATSGIVSYDPATNRILWNGAVDVGSGAWITFAVTINGDALPGTLIENFAYVDDKVNEPTELYCDVSIVAEEPRTYVVYLPLVMRGYGGPQLPDLVVESVEVTPAEPTAGAPWDLTITIKNTGTAPLPNGVWVDLYVDPIPERLPIEANEPFSDLCTFGAVWWIPQLQPGESIELTKDDILPDWLSFFPDPWQTPGDHILYVQVDSIDERTSTPPSWARVYESNESNNVFGPVVVPVLGVGGSSTDSQEAPADIPERLPPQ